MSAGNVQYRITRVIGQGAFGTVYEGQRVGEGLSRRVAMKLLHASHAGHTGAEGRLRDEARMLSLIHHRAIVGVDDLIRVDGAWCVVMEFVDGADLAELLEIGPIPARVAVHIAEEVASALHAAYSQPGPEGWPLHLVHRDVKPANIRLTPQGEVKLLDFGVARAEFNAREASTKGVGVGTVIYMAAERYRGEDTYAGDVYALGVTLFQLLTGVPPGASAADSDRRPPGRALKAQWAWLRELDADLFALIVAMMADEAEDRPSARECARRLSELRLRVAGELLEDWAERVVRALPPPAERGPKSRSSDAPPSSATLHIGQTIGGESALAPDDSGPPAPGPAVGSRPKTRETPWVYWVMAAALAGIVGITVAGVVVTLATITQGGGSATEPAPGKAAGAVSVPAEPTSKVEKPPVIAEKPAAPKAVSAPEAPPPTMPPPVAPIVAKPPKAEVQKVEVVRIVPPTPAPEPEPEVMVKAPPVEVAPRTGTVWVSGATGGTRLHGPDGDESVGTVPVGTYSATVSFDGGTSITVTGIRVKSGKTTRVRCDSGFATCSVAAPE
ncbi:hypothetical protein LBMAG42_25930 [Deltaproteobacteria bacterium]|nr:hypothetical protein LBMAG42_25930 [Deltaproteobacteria bacterium]